MQRASLSHMISERRLLKPESLSELQQLRDRYPYCATFQLLYAIGLSQADSIDKSEQISLAALYISDRGKLYDYATSATIKEDAIVAEPETEEPREIIPSGETEATGHVLPTITDESNKVYDEHIPVAIEGEETDNSGAESDDELPKDPLEAEILRTAIASLGELEAMSRLDELNETPYKHQEQVENTHDDEELSFGSWLFRMDKNRIPHSGEHTDSTIIEKFIQESPQITPAKKAFFNVADMSKRSIKEDESIVTETLAKIYEKQGDFKRAARAYGNLALKYPKKSSYFAALQKQAEEKNKN